MEIYRYIALLKLAPQISQLRRFLVQSFHDTVIASGVLSTQQMKDLLQTSVIAEKHQLFGK